MLLLLDTNILQIVGRQIAFGMYELLKMCAANIHTRDDWTLILSILEYIGTGIVSKNYNIGILFLLKKISINYYNIYLINVFTDNQFDNEAVSISDSNDDSGLDVKSVNNVSTPSSSPPDDKSGWLKVIITLHCIYYTISLSNEISCYRLNQTREC